MSWSNRCCVCAGDRLAPCLTVAGEVGEDGLAPTTAQFGTALSDIDRCEACGHMQLHAMPEDAALEVAYAEASSSAYVAEEAGQRETARRSLFALETARGGRRGRMLDLGCWVGFLLAEAEARGWECVGVEPSDFASAYARNELGLDVRTEELFTAELPPASFDAVMLGDVIEHLPDPGAALDRVASLLRPGGAIWLALPDAGSRVARAMGPRWWSVIPTHVQYFTRGSLVRLLEARGYRTLAIRTAPKAFTVRYYLDRIGGYSPAAARLAVALATRAGVSERMWAPDFRDRMEVVAMLRPTGRS